MKDIVIIGGGAVGLWCAWHLLEAGRNVTVLDFIPLASPGIIAKGIQWMFKKNSPFYIRPRMSPDLAQWLWQFYRSASRKHVTDSATLLRDMHVESRELYKHLDQTPGFNYQFQQKGILMLFKSADAERDELETAEAADRLGIEANYLTAEQLTQLEPGIQMAVRGAVHYPGDAHLTPHLFMPQMVSFLKQMGVEFLKQHEVTRIEDKGNSGAGILLKDGKMIDARQVIVATGSWSGSLMKKCGYHMPIQDGKGYSMTIQHTEAIPTIPSILHEARVAMTPMGGQLRISGTLEISGMDDKINTHKVNSILNAVPQYYPGMEIKNPGPVWFGYRPCTPDGLPYIGRWKDSTSILLATGHAMMGLSLAPVTGRMVRDLVLDTQRGISNPKLDPARFSS
jgi:D-amino-acid dehydrogenase